jgi:hypothetical protein
MSKYMETNSPGLKQLGKNPNTDTVLDLCNKVRGIGPFPEGIEYFDAE